MDNQRTAGTLAFALYWAWLFAAIIGSSLLGNVTTSYGIVIRLSGAAGLTCGLIAQYLLMPRISLVDSRVFVAICALFPVAYSCILLLPDLIAPSSPLIAVSMFLAGVSASLILNGIGGGLAARPRMQAIMSTCIASALGAFIAVVISLSPHTVAIACAGVLLPVSAVLFRIGRFVPEPETSEDRKKAFSVVRRYRSTLLFMLLYSMLFGFVLVSGAMVEPSEKEGILLLVAICAPGVLMLFLLVGTKARIDVESLRRVFLALSIVGLVPSLFSDSGITFASLLLLTISFGMFDISNFVTVYEIIRENDLPHLSSFALGRVLSELGIVIGWIAGIALFSWYPENGRIAVYVAIGLVALIGFGLAVFGRGKRGEGNTYLDLETNVPDPYLFRPKVIEDMAEEFSLSPREREIFEMLVAGRSPKRVSEKLFISESTAKTHCYHIYQKIGVHSQQDLLDLFESRLEGAWSSQWKPME